MDWKNLKDTASVWNAKATDMAKKGLETGKEYAEKPGVWSYAKLKEGTFTLKESASYEALQKEKRYAIFCIEESGDFTKFFLLRLPILLTKAWIETGSIRILLEDGDENLQKLVPGEKFPRMLIKSGDEPIQNRENEEELRSCIKNFSFYSKKEG